MKKTILTLIFVSACAVLARAEDVSVESSVSYDSSSPFDVGDENVFEKTDVGSSSGTDFYWLRRSETDRTEARIVPWDEGGSCLKVDGPRNAAESLARAVTSRTGPMRPIEQTRVSDARHATVCYDMTVTLTPCMPSPTLGPSEKIIVWCKAGVGAGDYVLHVTGGGFAGGLNVATVCDCTMSLPPGFDATGKLHRLAIRAIPDVTEGHRVLGFTVSLDGSDVVADDGTYAPAADFDLRALLTSEAKILYDARRLFFARAEAASDGALAIRGLAFGGQGHIGRIVTSETTPDVLVPEKVLTLRWDAGVNGLSYQVAGGAAVTLKAEEIRARSVDVALGRVDGSPRRVSVTATYDAACDYSAGAWSGRGGCTVEGTTFVCDAASTNPRGFVQSRREEIAVGGEGGVNTFAEAIELVRAATNAGPRTIVFKGENPVFEPTNTVADTEVEKFEKLYNSLYITREIAPPEHPLIIDLNGHTIKGHNGTYPVIYNVGGCVTIQDSAGGGRVVPAEPYAGNDKSAAQAAVGNYGNSKAVASMLIAGGTFDGGVINEGKGCENTFVIRDGAFISTNDQAFVHQPSVEDPNCYYAYDGMHWRASERKFFIWAGPANGDWNAAANWRGGEVPGPGDNAVFPRTGSPWTVRCTGTAKMAGSLWLEGDVNFAQGYLDLSAAKFEGEGRLAGSGTLLWTNAVPPNLSGVLATNWAGKVRVTGLAKATSLNALATWGTKDSTVVFAGVNGYINDAVAELRVPFALRLENAKASETETYGWKNVAGFTGGSVTFPKLLGDGTFVSPAAFAAINQQIRFLDVADYTGRMTVGGKRIVVGDALGAYPSGTLTYAPGVTVRAGLGWTAGTLSFGSSFTVLGRTTDTLVSFDKTAPDVSNAVVTVVNGTTATKNALVVVNQSVTFGDLTQHSKVNNQVVRGAETVVRMARARASVLLMDPAMTVEGNVVKVNGEDAAEFADYYTVTATQVAGGTALSLALNANAVPVIGEFGEGASTMMEEGEGLTWVIVSGARVGLWYGLQFRESLADGWDDAEVRCWQTALSDGEPLPLYMPTPESASGYWRVIVADEDPGANGEE